MDTPSNHPKCKVPMEQKLQVENLRMVMAALMLHLDCQECKVALGRSQDILLELEWDLGSFHLVRVVLEALELVVVALVALVGCIQARCQEGMELLRLPNMEFQEVYLGEYQEVYLGEFQEVHRLEEFQRLVDIHQQQKLLNMAQEGN